MANKKDKPNEEFESPKYNTESDSQTHSSSTASTKWRTVKSWSTSDSTSFSNSLSSSWSKKKDQRSDIESISLSDIVSKKPSSSNKTAKSPDYMFRSRNATIREIDTESHSGESGFTLGHDNGKGSMPKYLSDTTILQNNRRQIVDFVIANKLDNNTTNDRIRREFEAKLESEGLVIEETTYNNVRFLKVHTPWEILTEAAEFTKLDMPICENEYMTGDNDSVTYNLVLKGWFDYDRNVLPDLPKYFKAWFSRGRQKQFLIESKDAFFTSAQRSVLTNYVLENILVESDDHNSPDGCFPSFYETIGLQSLIDDDIYECAFPLHEGDYEERGRIEDRSLRSRLHECWSQTKNIFKYQPLDHIRLYFGERIGFYFAWLGFYTYMLIPAAFFGLLAQIHSVVYYVYYPDQVQFDICNKDKMGHVTMCPLCDECDTWKLNESCLQAKFSGYLTNHITILFSVFIAFWSTTFQELWKRYESSIMLRWHVKSFQKVDRIRPQYMAFKGRRATMIINPEKDTMEPKIHHKIKWYRHGVSYLMVLVSLCFTSMTFVMLLAFRNVADYKRISTYIAMSKAFQKIFQKVVMAGIAFILITILGKLYEYIARIMTDYELNRTDSDWEASFIWKLFVFQFINNTVPFLYLAFFKGKAVGYPNHYRTIFGWSLSTCNLDECFSDLFIQVLFNMIAKQAIKLFFDFVYHPFLKRMKQKKTNEVPILRLEKDYTLNAVPNRVIIYEYLELIIQYSQVTLFAAACPAASVIALISNIFEIRTDASKFIKQLRRPIAKRAQGIHIWLVILRGISTLAIVTNAFLIAFTSNYVHKYIYIHYYNTDTGISQLEGFVNYSLSAFSLRSLHKYDPTKHVSYDNAKGPNNETVCRYYDYREYKPPFKNTKIYWQVMSFKMIFVVVFVCVVLLFMVIIDYLVPDIPASVRINTVREDIFINQALLELGKNNPITHYMRDPFSQANRFNRLLRDNSTVGSKAFKFSDKDTFNTPSSRESLKGSSISTFGSSRSNSRSPKSQKGKNTTIRLSP